MKMTHALLSTSLGSLALSLILAPAALAQTGGAPAHLAQTALLRGGLAPEGVQSSDGDGDDAGIVGLWQWSYTSEGSAPVAPDGAVVDSGYKQLFADHNELVVSGERAPLTGAVCIGMWQKVGEHTYVVNHFGAGWEPDNPIDQTKNKNLESFLGPARIQEVIVLSEDGKSFTGSFTADQFTNADTKTPFVHLQGKLAGKRLTINSKASAFPF
jgi:hypothetical protein